jgi:hypothetical protein
MANSELSERLKEKKGDQSLLDFLIKIQEQAGGEMVGFSTMAAILSGQNTPGLSKAARVLVRAFPDLLPTILEESLGREEARRVIQQWLDEQGGAPCEAT